MMKPFLQRAILLAGSLFCMSANAHWILVDSESNLSFVSTKNNQISEIQHFKTLKGEFNADGKLQVAIDLSSIDSGIEIRDTRMREKLFLVDKFATANITAQLPNSVLSLAKGNSMSVTLPAELSLMGVSNKMDVTVQVTRKADNGFVATSTQPILISAADYGLTSGIEILQKLAGLKAIGHTVPVNFNLVFEAH